MLSHGVNNFRGSESYLPRKLVGKLVSYLLADPTKVQNWSKNRLKYKDITQHRFLEVGDNLYLLFGVFSTGNNFRQRCGFARESSGFPRTARRHTKLADPTEVQN